MSRFVRGACALALIFVIFPIFPVGKSETGESGDTQSGKNPDNWSITVPAAASPGDLIAVRFTAAVSLTDAAVTLRNPKGSAVSRTTAFASRIEATTDMIALVALPSTLESGIYSVEAEALQQGKRILSTMAVIVEKRAFLSETIDLDSANSAIKNNLGPERMAQIKALNEILFRQDQSAPRFAGPFKSPLNADRRTAYFGDRRTYRYADGKTELALHYGVDFGVPTGTPVFAMGDGLVVMAESRISTGWTVVIEHLPGVYSLYYHLDALTASRGELVRTGTLIGRSGATGLATGPHLHWEVRVNGEAVSPDFLVGRALY